jgi:hypothetical protein
MDSERWRRGNSFPQVVSRISATPERRLIVAERGGFEPPIPVKVWPLSRRLVSTTHAPLRISGPRIVNNHARVLRAVGRPMSPASSV